MIRTLTALCLLAAAAGCGAMDKARQNLAPVALPDLSRSDENVQVQMRQLYATLNQALDDRRKPSADLGAAYGKLGMLLQAGEYYDAAEPCYRNAQTLAPTEVQWPYYLGLLQRIRFSGPLILHSLREDQVESSIRFLRAKLRKIKAPSLAS